MIRCPCSWVHICLNRAVFLFLHFELFDERSHMRGDGGRKSVVLGLEALPNCRQPNAAVPSKNCLALRETVTPRSAGGRHTCRRRRWRCRRLRLSWPQFARDEVGGVMPKPVLHHLCRRIQLSIRSAVRNVAAIVDMGAPPFQLQAARKTSR
jgi:hypothetical protein